MTPDEIEKPADVIEGVATKCDVRPDPIPEGAFETLPDVYITGDGAIIEVPPATFVDVSQIVIDADETRFIESGPATKGWWTARKDGIETFTAPDGIAYVRARPDEDADVIVNFTRIPGMTPMRLVRADESSTVKRAARKKRRENAELRKRGYDVPSE